MLVLIFRSIIIYLLVLFILRMMGKRQIGELQPFELVITLIIADLACIPMADTAIPLLHGIVPLITLLILHALLTFLSQKSLKMRELISGRARLVITPSGIDYQTLKMLNMTINDLTEGVRTAGYFDFEDILYAIVETNGTINVIPKASAGPVAVSDIKVDKPENSLPITLITGGKLEPKNLRLAELDEEFIQTQLNLYGIKNFKDVTYLNINSQGKMYIQPKYSSYIIHNVNYKGGNKW